MTAKFAVLDLKSVKVKHPTEAPGREKTRLTKESGPRLKPGQVAGVKIGGDFACQKNPAFLQERQAVFDRVLALRAEEVASLPRTPITVTLPDGKELPGTAYETSPFDIAMEISKGLADSCVTAKVSYTGQRVVNPHSQVADSDIMGDVEMEEVVGGEMWDLKRPLEGDCTIELLKFDDQDAKTVFWHSSAHMLGEALEHIFGSHLTIGPPTTAGFYYDSFMGDTSLSEANFKAIDSEVSGIIKKKQVFERLEVTKEEALELFHYNPFKVQLITAKVPDGTRTTVYRCGDLIDLCRGPHVVHTGKVKAFATLRTSGTTWLGLDDNDPLQRVYGVSFPDKKQLKAHKQHLEDAKKRDHRAIGIQQKLFMFNELSPGAAFWLPHGARIYNKLMSFIRAQYWDRGYTEVISPNMFNKKLWEKSGHWDNYEDCMFSFDVEGQKFSLKPMNCPGHALMFADATRSYRDLPMRYADFGVLHRNELSGALRGLTRVRRFQQDDAHIFCRPDQIEEEIVAALEFMKFVYDVFGMSYKLELSTRPKKAIGEKAIWDVAEAKLASAMDTFAGVGGWKVNPGDGAFYGPKIDIKVMDAMERVHQCATIQLDFMHPIRFNLRYKTASDNAENFERPVMIHRAMLGSVERMAAVLIEHYGGKWPFWLSPRQVLVVPVKDSVNDYAQEVGAAVHKAGYYVETELSGDTMQKKVRNGQLSQFNYILVVGEKEKTDKTVNVRLRNNEVKGVVSLDGLFAMFQEHIDKYE